MKAIAIAVLMLAATTAQAYQGNFWLRAAIEKEMTGQVSGLTSVEWIYPATVKPVEVAAYPWLNYAPWKMWTAEVAPVYVQPPLRPEIKVAGGNIWTGGCKYVLQRWLRALHMGGPVA